VPDASWFAARTAGLGGVPYPRGTGPAPRSRSCKPSTSSLSLPPSLPYPTMPAEHKGARCFLGWSVHVWAVKRMAEMQRQRTCRCDVCIMILDPSTSPGANTVYFCESVCVRVGLERGEKGDGKVWLGRIVCVFVISSRSTSNGFTRARTHTDPHPHTFYWPHRYHSATHSTLGQRHQKRIHQVQHVVMFSIACVREKNVYRQQEPMETIDTTNTTHYWPPEPHTTRSLPSP
jgi:hypothetical protein